jgi:hypothetical protein
MTEERRQNLAAAANQPTERRAEDFVTAGFLAIRWDVDKRTVYKFIEVGDLDAVMFPGIGYRVRVASMHAFELKHGLKKS